jgi:hypothetical protein
MPTGKQIKIIKRAERNASRALGGDKRSIRVRNHMEQKRDAVAVVTEWVSDLRRKKAQEVACGFESLFGKAG